MGVVNTTYTFTSTDTITSAKMNNIIDDTTFTSDAIQGTTLQVVSPGKLAVNAGGITSNELAANSVVTAAITDSNVTTAKIADANVTQAKLASNVAGNGPAFRAFANGSQSISAITPTKIQLQNESFDTASAFDSSANYRFQPLVAGYYQVNCRLTLNNNINNNSILVMLYKNGSCIAIAGGTGSNFLFPSATSSDLVYLNGSTDYIEMYGYNGSASSYIVVATTFATGDSTNFSGALVRAA